MFKIISIMLCCLSFSITAAEYKIKITDEGYNGAVVIESALKCMEDYNQNGELCEKLLIEEFDLNCNIGDLNSETRQCRIVLDEIRTITCTGGYTDNGNGTCTGTQTISASYSCPSGYTTSGSNCYSDRTRNPSEGSCPSGYISLYNVCYKYYGEADNCESGYIFRNPEGYCENPILRLQGVHTCPASNPYKYYTSNSYWTYCLKFSGSITGASPTCDSGLDQSSYRCYDSSDIGQRPLTCSSGYTLNQSSGKCEGRFYTNKTYSCSSGFILSGSTCSKTVTESSGISSCSSGYIAINDSLCQQTIIEDAIITCPDTYNYNIEEDRCEKLDIKPLS